MLSRPMRTSALLLPAALLLGAGVLQAIPTQAPNIAKFFGKTTIFVGETTTLGFAITNPNSGSTLTGVSFNDTLPAGLIIATPNGLNPTTGCNGTVPTAVAGSTTIALSGATIPPVSACIFLVNVTATAPGVWVNTTSNVSSDQSADGDPATAKITVVGSENGVYQVNYISNLLSGDSYVNMTNAGTRGGYDITQTGFKPAGGICANVYVFDPSEEMVACCACYVSPDGLRSLSAVNDLVSKTLTAGKPNGIVVKLLATAPSGTRGDSADCNAASVGDVAPGLRAWATTLHQNTTASNYQMTENAFQNALLSFSEFQKLTTFCAFIKATGSTFGICNSCRVGGSLGGATR